MNPKLLNPKILCPVILKAAKSLCTQDHDDWDYSQFSCVQLWRVCLAQGWVYDDNRDLGRLYWRKIFAGAGPGSDYETVEDRLDFSEDAFEVRLLMLAFFHALVETGDVHQFNTP